MKYTVLLAALLSAPLYAQTVSFSNCPVPGSGGCSEVYVNASTSANAALNAICYAQSAQATGIRAATSVAISAVSKASAAVVTSTGHGFPISSLPMVTISGATGTGWTGINGTWTATVIDANTFSIPIDSSMFGTLAGTVVFTTTAPRLTVPEWSVFIFKYDVGGNLIWRGWLGGTPSYGAACSNAGSTTLNRQ